VVESVNNSNELEQENKKLKKNLSDKNTPIRNQQIGLIGVTALLFAAFLFRPSKVLEIIETITNDN
jgi:L-lysine 2,3-aminomutase